VSSHRYASDALFPVTQADVPDEQGRRTVIVASDLHPELRPDGGRDKLRYKTIPSYLSRYADLFDADEFWNGGDSGNLKDIAALLGYSLDPAKIPEDDPRDDYGFDRMKLVVGDEDEKVSSDHCGWYAELRGDPDLQQTLEEDARVEYGRTVATAVNADDPYLVRMAHEPHEFGIDWDTTAEDLADYDHHQLDQPQIVLYGHVHTPCARVLRNSVAIGLGSTAKNYRNGETDVWGDIPERSIFVVSFDEDVQVYHIDLENDELFDHHRFVQTDDGFVDARTETMEQDRIAALLEA
jgi:predicted phosphodiesterase